MRLPDRLSEAKHEKHTVRIAVDDPDDAECLRRLIAGWRRRRVS